jgi:hypothetical protein
VTPAGDEESEVGQNGGEKEMPVSSKRMVRGKKNEGP